jgi:hypothetical protein
VSESLSASLAVSLVAGALAGVAGAIVSSPADALLTKQAGGGSDSDRSSSGSDGTDAAGRGQLFEGVFAGVGVRCLFFAASISVQFLLYDYFRALLHVAPQVIF